MPSPGPPPVRSGRAQRIAGYAMASYVRMGLGVLVTLAITRASFRALKELHAGVSTNQAFGALSLTLALAGAVAFVETAGTTSLVRALSRHMHHGAARLQQVFSTGWVIGSSAGVLRALVLAAVAPFLPSLFGLPVALGRHMTQALYILAAAQVLAGSFRVWNAALEAEELFPFEYLRILVSQFMRLGLAYYAPSLPGGPFVGLALAWCLPELITLALWAAVIAARDARWRPHPSLFNKKDAKDLANIGGWTLLTGAASNLFMRADQIVITSFLGPAYNGLYAVADQLRGQIAQFCTVVNGVLLPTASKSAAIGDHDSLRRIYIRATRAVMGLAIGPSVALGVFAVPFLKLLLGDDQPEVMAQLPEQVLALRLALLILVLRLGITTSWNVFQASGHVKEPALTAVAEGLLNQALSVLMILGFAFGLPGVYLGSLAAQLLRLVLVHPRQLQAAIGGSKWDNAWESLAMPLAGAVLLTAACLGLQALNWGWHKTTIGLMVIGVYYCYWMWKFLMDTTERTALKGVVKKLLGKK